MSLRGITKGTELEEFIGKLAKGEAMAAGMYFGLANVAKEQGYVEISETLMKIGADEARHSGIYSFLNGNVNEDIFKVLTMLEKEETNAGPSIGGLAQKAKELGMDEVASLIQGAADDEANHAKLINDILASQNK